ncbi:MAG TPA: 50S ribosomal protein L11 methyltransferase [Ilumatobacteraceae bacterium]
MGGATSGPSVAQRLLHDASGKARELMVRSPRVRRLVYSVRNRRLFADLAQHDRMLADSVRIEAYYDALSAHIRPGDVVVDLGTGSGVLGFFAARLGAARVHAIEHGPIIEAAQAVALANGIDNVVFHRVHSSDFELPERADVILHEQIGEALFDERVVENVAELRDRILKPGGRIFPAHLRLFIEPVEVRADTRAPFAWEQELHGIDFRALEQFGRTQPSSYRQPRFRPFPFERFLCEPAPVVEVDLHHANPGELPTEISYRREVVADGMLDGLCVYFAAGFDPERWFTSSPAAPPTSWGSPLLRVEQRSVKAGDIIEVTVSAVDLAYPANWTWNVDVTAG